MAEAVGGIHVVIGARAGTGRELIKRLCEQPKEVVSEIRGIMRDTSNIPEELRDLKDSRVKYFKGDVTLSETLDDPFEGALIVYFCASASPPGPKYREVDELGVKNAAEVALRKGVIRFILISSQLVHPSNKWNFVRILLNNIIGRDVMDAKYAGEQHLRRSGLVYTIIRPGRLTDAPIGKARVHVGQTNSRFTAPGSSGSRISRADLADICLAAALSDDCKNVTFEVAAESLPSKSELESTTSTMADGACKATQVTSPLTTRRQSVDRNDVFGFKVLSSVWDDEMV